MATPPGSLASRMITRARALVRCQAMEAPMIPAPTIITFGPLPGIITLCTMSARVFSILIESKLNPGSSFYRASYRKTGSHFSGSTLVLCFTVLLIGKPVPIFPEALCWFSVLPCFLSENRFPLFRKHSSSTPLPWPRNCGAAAGISRTRDRIWFAPGPCAPSWELFRFSSDPP